jgi:hypothetical protein
VAGDLGGQDLGTESVDSKKKRGMLWYVIRALSRPDVACKSQHIWSKVALNLIGAGEAGKTNDGFVEQRRKARKVENHGQPNRDSCLK